MRTTIEMTSSTQLTKYVSQTDKMVWRMEVNINKIEHLLFGESVDDVQLETIAIKVYREYKFGTTGEDIEQSGRNFCFKLFYSNSHIAL